MSDNIHFFHFFWGGEGSTLESETADTILLLHCFKYYWEWDRDNEYLYVISAPIIPMAVWGKVVSTTWLFHLQWVMYEVSWSWVSSWTKEGITSLLPYVAENLCFPTVSTCISAETHRLQTGVARQWFEGRRVVARADLPNGYRLYSCQTLISWRLSLWRNSLLHSRHTNT